MKNQIGTHDMTQLTIKCIPSPYTSFDFPHNSYTTPRFIVTL